MSPEQRRRVEAAFQEAVELPPDQQVARARVLCAGDTAVYNEVRSLLSNADEQDTFLANPAFTWPTNPPDAALPPPPQQIPGYRILRMIGQGGMGVVYEAEQQNPRRTVALKVIRPGLASAELMRRFEHEAWVLGQLQHPGIAQIYEAGAVDTPHGRQPFFAMELIRGRTLSQYIKEAAPDRRQRLDLLARVCDAAAHAHQRGVVHRDLKPANILVVEEAPVTRREDAAGTRATTSPTASHPFVPTALRTVAGQALTAQPKILDFGVARASGGDTQMLSMHTTAGQLIGTLPYMSPEQVAGDASAVDHRADVYSLGVILYELLVDRLPHKLENRSIPDAARIIRDEEPTRLSALDRTLRGDLETIVEKTLEKDPARRYDSAGELAADLRRYLADEPIVARPASALYQFNKFARRNRGAVIFAGLFVLALFAASIVSGFAWIRAVHERDIAKSERQRALAESAKAKSTVDFLTRMLGAADTGLNAGKDLTVREVLEKSARDLNEGELADQPEVQLAIRTTIGKTYQALNVFEPAAEQLQQALDLATRLFGPESEPVARALNNLGEVAAYREDTETAWPLLDRSVKLYRRLPNADLLELSNAINNYAIVSDGKIPLEQIERLHAEVIALRRSATRDPSPLVAHALISHANVLDQLGKKDDAVREHTEALDILRRAGQTNMPHYFVLLNNIGRMHYYAREYALAEPLLLECRQRAAELYKEDNLFSSVACGNLADLRLAQDRAAEAEPLVQEALRLSEKLREPDNPITLNLRRLRAAILLDLGRFDEADSLVRPLLAHLPDTGDQRDVALARTNLMLSDIERRRGNLDEAESLARQARPVFARLYGESNHETAKSDVSLGLTLARAGKSSDAQAALQRSIATLEKLQPVDHLLIGRLSRELGDVLIATGAMETAEAALLKSHREFNAHGSAQGQRSAAERLAQLYRQLGRQDTARQWTTRAAQ